MITVNLKLKDEKKHSVRYDATDESPAMKSAYIEKSVLPRPFPKEITITIELAS